MARAVSRRPLTAEARVRSRVSPCGICSGQSGTGAGFVPSTSVFRCQFHSTGAPLKWIIRKKNFIIFLIGFHNKPSRLRYVRSICCGAIKKKWKSYHHGSLLCFREILSIKQEEVGSNLTLLWSICLCRPIANFDLITCETLCVLCYQV
jgi:hypothetical protein